MGKVSYVAFVLSLFVPHLFLFWCLGRAMIVIVAFLWYLRMFAMQAKSNSSYLKMQEYCIRFWILPI